MIVHHLHKVHELLSVLEQPGAEVSVLRGLLTQDGSFPSLPRSQRGLAVLVGI